MRKWVRDWQELIAFCAIAALVFGLGIVAATAADKEPTLEERVEKLEYRVEMLTKALEHFSEAQRTMLHHMQPRVAKKWSELEPFSAPVIRQWLDLQPSFLKAYLGLPYYPILKRAGLPPKED